MTLYTAFGAVGNSRADLNHHLWRSTMAAQLQWVISWFFQALLRRVGLSGVWLSTIRIILSLMELYVERCQISRILVICLS